MLCLEVKKAFDFLGEEEKSDLEFGVEEEEEALRSRALVFKI